VKSQFRQFLITNYQLLLIAFALFAASFVLYTRTMAPGLLEGDEGEFQINIFKLGVSHTGYPLFFLLGKLWTLLIPIGTIAFRANLFSVFWGALAVAIVFVFVHWLTSNRWAGIICALLFAASRVEWSQAVIPRVYTMNSFFVVLVTFLFFVWRAGKIDLTVPVFAFGLALTNHRTIIWMAPAIAIFVLWREREKILAPRRLLSLILAFVLPLLLYYYVWWRGESDVGVEFHWKDFNDEILGGYVRASWRFGPWNWLVSRVTELYIPLLIEQFTALGFVAGIVGMLALALNRAPRGFPRDLPAREAFVFILIANFANAAFCVIFWVIDIEKFFLQSFITYLFFIGVGIAVVWDWVAEKSKQLTVNSNQSFSKRLLFTVHCSLLTLFLAAGGVLIAKNYAENDWSKRNDAAEMWSENLSLPIEQRAIIAGSWESLVPLEYAMYVDGRRTDLDRWKVIVKNYQLGQVPYESRREEIEQAVRAGRPVYMTAHPSDTETLGMLADEFRLTRVGELWRVLPLAPNAPLPTGKPVAIFSDQAGRTIELVGVTIAPQKIRAGEFVLATFFWRAPESVSAHFTISARLLDAQSRIVMQRDAEPASGRRATIGWAPGEIVQDDVGLFVLPDAAPGIYRVGVIVYNGASGENLKPTQGSAEQSELFIVGEVTVAP